MDSCSKSSLFSCGDPSLLSQSKRYCSRSPRPPTTGRRAETKTAAAKVELLGQTLLDGTPPVFMPLDGRLGPVKPETVVGWHRAGFRLYWRWRSRPLGGRPKITKEIRVLIRTIGAREPGLGCPEDP